MNSPLTEKLLPNLSKEESCASLKLSNGSSISECTFNFTNSIVGAGALGVGSAFAASGGLISIISLLSVALLAKISLDLIISLTISMGGGNISYEELGNISYGVSGRVAVLLCKALYSFGCLVAYIIVIKDNFGAGLGHIAYGDNFFVEDNDDIETWVQSFLREDKVVVSLLSILLILPLCFHRDIAPLAKFSALGMLSIVVITFIVIHLYMINPVDKSTGNDIVERWFEVRSGYMQSLGTFVFSFVCHNTVNLAYESLDAPVQNITGWKQVSLFSILISTSISLTLGLFVYMTFWEETGSDIFDQYPPSLSIDTAKILLCVNMVLTFPLPFFTCREMLIVIFSDLNCFFSSEANTVGINLSADQESNYPESLEDSALSTNIELKDTMLKKWTIPGEDRQLILPCHVLCTIGLWGTITFLAVIAPSLGDVLDLVGCATGTPIAFILPAVFSLKLVGYTKKAMLILFCGTVIAILGTYFSLVQLFKDT